MNTPPAPKHLSEQAKRVWRLLHRGFVFEPADAILLEQLCECFDRVRSAQAQIKKDGLVLKSGTVRKRHPATEVERAARGQLLECWRTLKLNAAGDGLPIRPGRPAGGKKKREAPQWLEQNEEP